VENAGESSLQVANTGISNRFNQKDITKIKLGKKS